MAILSKAIMPMDLFCLQAWYASCASVVIARINYNGTATPQGFQPQPKPECLQ